MTAAETPNGEKYPTQKSETYLIDPFVASEKEAVFAEGSVDTNIGLVGLIDCEVSVHA